MTDDAKRLAWIRKRPCCLQGVTAHPCYGAVEAHHEQGHGLALRAPDERAFPLCQRHHTQLHALNGYFRGWLKQTRKDWEAEMVANYQALYAADTAEF